ncbi:MAG: zeta toxin family protein [Oscillospiraceae bacterium]
MKKPYVVAIAGGTCSGKSTLTDILCESLEKEHPVVTLNMDKYFKKNPPITIAPISRIEYVEHNHPTTLELDRLLDDFHTALQGESALILVEGLFALYIDEIREAADLKIFVDLASDARLVRRIKKHMSWGQTYEQVTDRYIDTVRFRHNELIEPTRWHADLIVNGTLDMNKGADIAKTYILAQLT